MLGFMISDPNLVPLNHTNVPYHQFLIAVVVLELKIHVARRLETSFHRSKNTGFRKPLLTLRHPC